MRIDPASPISAPMIFPSSVEHLETRIALSTLASLSPEISADGKSATFVDVDGDIFSVTTTKGTFTAANFTYVGSLETGFGYLQKIDVGFATFGKKFQGAKLTVTIDQLVGDGFADVGYINAAGIDLKQVSVDGDLVRIDVGDANFRTPATGLLQAAQLGFHTAEEAGVSDFNSVAVGKIKALDIGSWIDASISVVGGPTPKTEKFGSIGRATIQTMLGGDIARSASLTTSGPIGTLVVQADLIGGEGDGSGVILCGGRISSLTIGGSILGGGGDLSGAVLTDDSGSIGTAVIGGNVEGGTGESSGRIVSPSKIKSLVINGDLKAGATNLSGSVAFEAAKSITVGGNLIGGPVIGGILVDKVLTKLSLGGSDGTNGPAYVIAGGPLSGGFAIEKITVTNSLTGARILAGYDADLELINPNARIGKIMIGEDLIATDIVAGIDGVNGVFGDLDDRLATADSKLKYLSSIGSIVVGGMIAGTEGGTDQFGILAEKIGSIQVAGGALPLGKKTVDDLQLGGFGDYRLREIVRIA